MGIAVGILLLLGLLGFCSWIGVYLLAMSLASGKEMPKKDDL